MTDTKPNNTACETCAGERAIERATSSTRYVTVPCPDCASTPGALNNTACGELATANEQALFDKWHIKYGPGFVTYSSFNSIEKAAAWKAWQARALAQQAAHETLIDEPTAAQFKVPGEPWESCSIDEEEVMRARGYKFRYLYAAPVDASQLATTASTSIDTPEFRALEANFVRATLDLSTKDHHADNTALFAARSAVIAHIDSRATAPSGEATAWLYTVEPGDIEDWPWPFAFVANDAHPAIKEAIEAFPVYRAQQSAEQAAAPIPTAAEHVERNKFAVTAGWLSGWNECRDFVLSASAGEGKDGGQSASGDQELTDLIVQLKKYPSLSAPVDDLVAYIDGRVASAIRTQPPAADSQEGGA